MIQRRQEAARERIEAYEATLRRVSPAARPAPDLDNAIAEAIQGFGGAAIRSRECWRPKRKTRDGGRRRIAAARHLFARFAVPAALEAVWLSTEGLDAAEIQLRKRWYIAAASGQSLYKAEAHDWLSRREVHAFLNPPGDPGFEAAFWQAIARGYTADVGIALRIARSKIARSPRSDLAFWREVARFFCANPASLEAMDDLCDYLAAVRARDRSWSLKGRTLASLTRQTDEWHRDHAAVQRFELARRNAARLAAARGEHVEPDGGRWAGSPLADWSWKPSDDRKHREEFVVMQLNSAAHLVAESRAMRHCVWTYAAKCISGNASIWALRRRTPGNVDRLLTIELDRQNRAVQVRGFGNRLASTDEERVLARWAKAKGVAL